MGMGQTKTLSSPLAHLPSLFFFPFLICERSVRVLGERRDKDGGSAGFSCTRATLLTMEKLIFVAFPTQVGSLTLCSSSDSAG